MAARARVAITPADVGSRVSVRRRDDTGSGPGLTDVVGILEAWSDAQLRIRRRNGDCVTVPVDALVAGKVVPPPPPRR